MTQRKQVLPQEALENHIRSLNLQNVVGLAETVWAPITFAPNFGVISDLIKVTDSRFWWLHYLKLVTNTFRLQHPSPDNQFRANSLNSIQWTPNRTEQLVLIEQPEHRTGRTAGFELTVRSSDSEHWTVRTPKISKIFEQGEQTAVGLRSTPSVRTLVDRASGTVRHGSLGSCHSDIRAKFSNKNVNALKRGQGKIEALDMFIRINFEINFGTWN